MDRYECIVAFTDLQDENHVYHPGDKFPWDGKRVSVDRILELSTNKNKLHRPLIKVVKVEVETDTVNDEVDVKPEATVETEVVAEPKKKTQPKSRSKKKKEE